MNKQTKLILTVVGAAAIIVPMVLLLTLGSKTQEIPQVSSDSRNIDTKNIQNVTKNPSASETPVPTPLPTPQPTETPKSVPTATSSATGQP